MTALQAHLKAMERVLSPGDLAKVIATTPETVSRLRGGRRPRRTNEVAVLTLHAVIDAALVAMGGDAAAVRDALLSRLCAPGGSALTDALRRGDADAALATIGITGDATEVPDHDLADDLAADLAFDARMAAIEAAAPPRTGAPPPPWPVPERLTAARDAVREAFLEFQPDADIEERVNPGEQPDDEQVLLYVSIPGLEREQVRDRLCDFRDARWDDLLDELDGDVLVVTR